VLDDFHLAATPPVCAIVQALLDRAPALTLALTTRSTPELALPRLRVRHQLTEVTAADLRFSPDETLRFLRHTMQIDIAADLGAALTQRAEGWVGALQLAALSLQGLDPARQAAFVAAFDGDHRYIADYLSDEVLRQLSLELRNFLLTTAPLTRLCAPLCDALLAEAANGALPAPGYSQTMLETIERRNLFLTPLDAHRQWYRYHPLFGDLLRARSDRERPELTPRLHRRAAAWWLQAADADAAMHHALQSGDPSFAADIAQQFGVPMVGGSRLGVFLHWLQQLDPAAVAVRPYLLAAAAWAHVLTGDVDQALRDVTQAAAALPHFTGLVSAVDRRQITAAEVSGHLHAVRSYAARLHGDDDSVMRYAHRALEYLPSDAYTVRSVVALNLGLLEIEHGDLDAALRSCQEAYLMGMHNTANLFVAISALDLQGEIYLGRGQLAEATERFQAVLKLGAQDGPLPPAVGMGHLGLARIALLQDDVVAARQLLSHGRQLAQEIASSEAMRQAALFAVEIALYTGDVVQARRLLADIDVHVPSGHAGHDLSETYAVIGSRLALAEGDLVAARAWLDDLPSRTEPTGAQQRQDNGAILQRARLLLAQQQATAALRLLGELMQQAQACNDWQTAVTARLLSVRAHSLQGEPAAAYTATVDALRLSAPQAAIGLFVMESAALRDLIERAAHSEPDASAFAVRVLQRTQPATLPLIDPLSARELEVLRLMAAGYTNKAIAAALIIAPSTVKTHSNHILAKLNAANRTEAVARARATGLLP
ncbi:MAG TPA: LuxR C-terminal-related transcriptional regulator, partial [Caldilinea sp.]|nr:LuxR C-terminal-related transcriptional regulator [Caldilinea sp.]